MNGLPRVDVLGTRVTAASFADVVERLEAAVEAREAAVFSAATVYSVMLGFDDPDFRAAVNGAAEVLADGMPLVWLARREVPGAERAHGDDVFLHCCETRPGWRHFLLGGAPGQPDEVAAELRRRVPKLNIVGTRATPVRPLAGAENRATLDQIRESEADLVWVGMGTPAQDHWMAAQVEAVGRPMVGVGSSFNLFSGRTRPTPAWLRRAGLQWAHRMLQEPRRLARRYLVYNSRFIWALATGARPAPIAPPAPSSGPGSRRTGR